MTTWRSEVLRPANSGAFYAFTLVDGKQFCMSPVGVSPANDVVTSCDPNVEWIGHERDIARLLVESFKQIPQVASICAQFVSDGIVIWTLLEAYDREARERVYEKELDICQSIGACDFDFRVSSIDLVPVNELVKAGSHEIFKRP